MIFTLYFIKKMTSIEINNDWNEKTPILVLINYYDGDVEWRNRLALPHIVYTKTDPSRGPYNAINKAKSETNLLKFIYEFYDRLPLHVVNVHQYEIKPYSHDGSLVDILNDPKLKDKFDNENINGYWNFNSYIMGNAAPQVEKMLACGWWQATMQPWFGDIHLYHDFTLGHKGCNQFIVSRERILSLPREFYMNMYNWLVENSTGPPRGVDHNDEPSSNLWTSRYMEWTWELIFAAHKPTENVFQRIDNDLQIRALYGADNYQIDITRRFLKQFMHGRFLIIEKSVNFNNIFTDVVYNTLKLLSITIKKDGKQLEYKIDETHETFTISLLDVANQL